MSFRLSKVAKECSREQSDQPSVEAVQANIILSLRELYCRSTRLAWMYAGTAIRMAQELRLGKEYFRNCSANEQETNRRVLWTCFIMDRILCFLTARPQVFRTRHISIQLPCPSRKFLFGESFRGPGITDFEAISSEPVEVLPYLIKAVDLWGVLVDLFGTVGNASPSGLVEDEAEFLRAHNAVLQWMDALPPRMAWSMRNYRTFCLLGEGNLFVSMHMTLNHALCTLQQAHLPEPASFDQPQTSPQEHTWSRDIATTCLRHANMITDIACSLHNGDVNDRACLRSPFSGAAILSAACVQLWKAHSRFELGEHDTETAAEKASSLTDILRSWQLEWPIATSWIESIELINTLYAVAYKTDDTMPQSLDLAQNDSFGVPSGNVPEAGSTGLPEPSNVAPRVFEKIRHIMFTISEPTVLRKLQSRLHIRNLWSHMSLQAQMPAMNAWLIDNSVDFPASASTTEVPFGWDEYMAMLDPP